MGVLGEKVKRNAEIEGKKGEYKEKRNEEGRRRNNAVCRDVVWGEFEGKIGEY